VERTGITDEEALKRVKLQMSNELRVSRANVVLCTLWHYDVTQKQVNKHLSIGQCVVTTAVSIIPLLGK